MASRQLDEERIFHTARGIPDPEIRSDYLDQICTGDQALRERVEALLDVHEKEQDFLKSSPEPAATVDQPPLTERPGSAIGRYRLMEQVGEGGMGIVFVAQQERPIRRKVALKVIKPGMDSRAVVARFEAERQALAMMDHPNIAKVLDAGTTESGRPYFAMELVRGIPITEYCDRNKLTIRERLELFMRVCQAIQHAHQKGIIHRDIKPSNVLVTLHDGKPVPKVIDFGVAKALNARLTDRTIYTEHLQIVGTLLYMSPEQAELSGLDIDTRSDVYALGVLLYELLTGTTPFEQAELDEAGFDEQRRLIREREPPRASVRVSNLGETATAVAEHRRTDSRRLQQAIQGELDWMVMKALDKDRNRRYETAASLADDIQRFLHNEAVAACPPSSWYRFRKFVRRNKGPVAAAVAVAAVLIVGIVGAVVVSLKLSRSNSELLATQARLRLALIEMAVVEAMTNDQARAEEAIDSAKLAGASDSWESMLHALVAINLGHCEKAIRLLDGVCKSEPANVAAHGMLADAYLVAGRLDDHLYTCSDLDRLQATSDLDVLFKAHAECGFWDPASSVSRLDDLVEGRKSWALARVMLADAKLCYAWDTGDLTHAEEAIEYLSVAKQTLPNSPIVYATELLANLTIAESLKDQSLGCEEWLQRADTAAKVLQDRFPLHADLRALAAYYAIRSSDAERTDRAIKDLRKAYKTNKVYYAESICQAMQLRSNSFLEVSETPSAPFLMGLLETTQDPKVVVEACRALNARDDLQDFHRIWLQIYLYVCGEQAEAQSEWNKMLAGNNKRLFFEEYPLRLFSGDWSCERLLSEASGSGNRLQLAQFCIACKYLFIDGNRKLAKAHFDESTEFHHVGGDCYHWAKAYSHRLKDRTWPHWLPDPQHP